MRLWFGSRKCGHVNPHVALENARVSGFTLRPTIWQSSSITSTTLPSPDVIRVVCPCAKRQALIASAALSCGW